MRPDLSARLGDIVRRHEKSSRIPSVLVAVRHPESGFRWSHGDPERSYCIASITKLFTTTMAIQLIDSGAVDFRTPAVEVLGDEVLRGLAVYDGLDYFAAITVEDLLAHTSGVPDYFDRKGPDGTSYLHKALAGDRGASFEDFLELSRRIPARFSPGTPGKCEYSDTNFELLGRLIETIDRRSYGESLQERILTPLDLSSTWLLTPENLAGYDRVLPLYYGKRRLHLPRTVASARAAGALVSTIDDQLAFLDAFRAGRLFPARHLGRLTAQWRSVFSRLTPLQYGIGVMRFHMPRWMSPFAAVPDMVGHSGSVGSFLYYAPESGISVCGTVNQLKHRSLPYPLLAQLTLAAARGLSC